MGPILDLQRPSVTFILLSLALASIYWLRLLFRRPLFPKGSPVLVDEYPVVGAWSFFSRRIDFWRHGTAQSKTGRFSFYVGKLPVVSVSGVEGRKTFFESKELSFSEGYAVLFGNAPRFSVKNEDGVETSGVEGGFDTYFNRRITRLMKKGRFVRNLHLLVNDTRQALSQLAKAESNILDPFDDIYRIVYRLTVRTVACNDIADNPDLLSRSLKAFETIDASTTPSTVIFPWLPTPASVKRMVAGARLYRMVQNIVEARKSAGVRGEDALQFLVDQGDSIAQIISFVIGSLYAGVLNTGINAAWILVYLSTDSHWMDVVRQEVDAAIDKHRTNSAQSKGDILTSFALGDWETEFPNIDLCLRESIRFHLTGTAFRRNVSGKDMILGKEIIPKDAYLVYAVDDIHFDPEIYTDPQTWDPSRYLPHRAEDKKVQNGYLGWGTGRHPCHGMRFAKLETFIIIAFFVATFDFQLVDEQGYPKMAWPETDRNEHAAHKPRTPVRLKYTLKD
ncbi:cytochrome P450 6A1 [Eremomyces bilateralis CBS 781.70]|uniref:Cytochrome P450 6A1 n=1 Tax=Eremomyces bilateralis CBS 781.70 TaxID=1392243 RepID=A0A6G1GC28_9PEZI|nr:cytochrome P450 6A1 [Eremomyces bilateralis CBS 781.70]KAF1815451.1 cytochrome P450 6A1 [Eremomyces bilateralis CBS 781.70]